MEDSTEVGVCGEVTRAVRSGSGHTGRVENTGPRHVKAEGAVDEDGGEDAQRAEASGGERSKWAES